MKRLLPGSAGILPARFERREIATRRQDAGPPRGGFSPWLVVLVAFSASAQDADKIPTLAPLYPELPPTFWEQHGDAIIIGGVVLLALVAVGVLLALRKKPVEIIPPAVQARNEFKALQALPEDGAVLSKASQILRRYFIAAFALPPGELTTAEFCRVVSINENIDTELSSAVAAFLRECDERKFKAGAVPLSGGVARALALVERGEALRCPPPSAKS